MLRFKVPPGPWVGHLEGTGAMAGKKGSSGG